MTDVQLLVTLIEQDPESEISAAMLTDELMEARGMIRSEADRHVERVRKTARQVLQMKFAAGLIAAKGPAYRALLDTIADAHPLFFASMCTIYVVSGDGPPRRADPPKEDNSHLVGPYKCLALPAGWVVQWFRRNTFPIEPVTVRRRRK